MTNFSTFLFEHWILSSAFVVILSALLVCELSASKESSDITTEKAIDLINHSNAVVLDVRTETEYKAHHIINAVNVPLNNITTANKKLAKYNKKNVIIVCSKSTPKSQVIKKLKEVGINSVFNLTNGMQAWDKDNLPTVKS